jgi:serine/threonine protein kinase
MQHLPKSIGPLVLERLTWAGFGEERYEARLEGSPERRVMARRLPMSLTRDKTRLDEVEARVRDLLGVRHPFLVPAVDLVRDGDARYLVEDQGNSVDMGRVLRWCRQNHQSLPHNVFLNLATQVCNGLEAMHGRPGRGTACSSVLHLALQPAAIFATREGKVILGTFGLSAFPATIPQTGPNAPGGYPLRYLSPEQSQPEQKLTPASDIFVLASVLFELLTLEPLFPAEDTIFTIQRLRRADTAAQLARVKALMPGLDKVFSRALALSPHHRYQRAFVLREDLRGLMAGYSFTSITDDTRSFLEPLFAPPATPPPVRSSSALGRALDAKGPIDSFDDMPPTRIDPDPTFTAARLKGPPAPASPRTPPMPAVAGRPAWVDAIAPELPSEPASLRPPVSNDFVPFTTAGFLAQNTALEDPSMTEAPAPGRALAIVLDAVPEVIFGQASPASSPEPASTVFFPVAPTPSPENGPLPAPAKPAPALSAPVFSRQLPPPVRSTLPSAPASAALVFETSPPAMVRHERIADGTIEGRTPTAPSFSPILLGLVGLSVVLLCSGVLWLGLGRYEAWRAASFAKGVPEASDAAHPPAEVLLPGPTVPPERLAVVETPEGPAGPGSGNAASPTRTAPAPTSHPEAEDPAAYLDFPAPSLPTPSADESHTDLDRYSPVAARGALTPADVSVLESVQLHDPEFTRSRLLLVMNARKKGNDGALRQYLSEAASLPENAYNPIVLVEQARYAVNKGEYQKALEKAQLAERHWARIPSELIFTKKAEIYEIQASSYQGLFNESGDNLDLLERAIHEWRRYRDHVGQKPNSDLTRRADAEIRKLEDEKARLQ